MSALSEKGITFPVTFTTEVLGNASGGTSRSAIWESLLRAGFKIDFEKLAGWKGLSLTVDGLYSQGSGLTSEAAHDFNTLSNIDAIFPVAAPGVRLRGAPDNSFYAELAFFSGDVGEPGTTNKHNTRLSFRSEDGVLVFAEIGYKLNPKEKEPALPTAPDELPDASQPPLLSGTYKLSGFYNSGRFADGAGGRSHHGNFSVYVIADQGALAPGWKRRPRPLLLHQKMGIAPNDRNTVTFYADTGLNFKGPYGATRIWWASASAMQS